MSCFHSAEGENSRGKWDRRPIIGQLADIKIQAGMQPMLQVTRQQKQRGWGQGKHRRKKQEREMGGGSKLEAKGGVCGLTSCREPWA